MAGTTRITTDEALRAHLLARLQGDRQVCAIVGAPGSGKSTLAEAIVDGLNDRVPGCAALLPMDGFHYDNLHLEPAGLLPRKGAPETFDVGGLRHMLERLRRNEEAFVAIPVFDRDIEIARAGARLIAQSVRLIVAEGNYLLLDRAPWTSLRPLFDVTVMLDVPEETLRARLERRWRGYGLDADAMARKIDDNDLPNARLVHDASAPADFVLRSGAA